MTQTLAAEKAESQVIPGAMPSAAQGVLCRPSAPSMHLPTSNALMKEKSRHHGSFFLASFVSALSLGLRSIFLPVRVPLVLYVNEAHNLL